MRRILSRFGFSSGHHDSHSVVLNKTQSWIENNSGPLSQIYGFKDLHYHPHADDTNPYHHLIEAPFFSFERLYFMDAYYHNDEDEPLMNTPHGYMVMDAPIDPEYDFGEQDYELMLLLSAAFAIGIIYGQSAVTNDAGYAEALARSNVLVGEIEAKILKIREEDANLEDIRDRLRSEL